jgi:hypothetical protein
MLLAEFAAACQGKSLKRVEFSTRPLAKNHGAMATLEQISGKSVIPRNTTLCHGWSLFSMGFRSYSTGNDRN